MSRFAPHTVKAFVHLTSKIFISISVIRHPAIRCLEIQTLQPESSGNWNLGVEYQFKSSLLGRVHLYRNNLQNLIEAERIGESVLGGSKFQYFNVSEAFTEGVEVELSTRSIGGFSATIGYAYLNGADKETGLALLNRSKHSGNLKLAYANRDAGFNVDLRGRYASRWGFFDDGDKVLEDEEYAPSNWIWNIRGSKQVLQMAQSFRRRQ